MRLVCSLCNHLKSSNIIGCTGPTTQRYYFCFFDEDQVRKLGFQLPYPSPAWCPRRKEEPTPCH